MGNLDFVEYEQTTIHAGYEKRNTTTEIVQTGISDGGVDCTDVSVGINYEPGDWFVTSEWIQSQTAYTSDAMYVGAGYHIKKFTPYLIHSQNTAGSFPQGYIPTAIKLQLANRAQETNSVGVRMDFKKYFDIKLQYDRVTLSNNSNGFLANVPENTILYGSSFDLISAVIDFVF